ncbi:hypothetical protein D0Y65_004343 [Glycine soja]|uniref:Metalloenzyme domain-containing protein n=1 Tax=Glycine soja TaxID=3848 RepID=A0A445LQM7_GLYSO|nr:hypothetical protein D0Y65_004343 [Glycine soja]
MLQVTPFLNRQGLWPCMVAPMKIIVGLGLSLGIDILDAPGETGDYRTLLTSKASTIAKALSAPLQSCPRVFVPGEDELKAGRPDGYDFGFLHIKVIFIYKSFDYLILMRPYMVLHAIDDDVHDKGNILKVKALEAVDKALGQLAGLLWVAESTGKFQFFLCAKGDHSTPVEYGDHSFESVPFAICRLKDFVGAIGESTISKSSLDPFPIPSVKSGEDLLDDLETKERRDKCCEAYRGDSVYQMNEAAVAKGCLGCIPGGEMVGIIKKFINLDAGTN